MLTLEEILALPAGRELDVAIAEHVLGHVWLHNKRYGFLRDEEDADDIVEDSSANYGKHPNHEGGAWIAPDEKYSTDIAAAWGLVNCLEVGGWGHKHQVFSAAAECPGWQWTFMRPGGGLGACIAGAEGETAPLAICRAALLATLSAPLPTKREEAGHE